ncbi:MAG: DSD1 family PLP-dependent enzyme, partial [Anaerolineae bacterium]
MTNLWIGKPWTELDTPALCVDVPTLSRNIQHMAKIAREAGVALRPHIKTHKCPQIAQRLLDAGAVGLTCAKVS